MSGKAKSTRPKVYYIAPNGIKIELKGFGPAFLYVQEQVRTEFTKAFQVPKDMLFPDAKLVNITVHEPRADVALTDELRNKGSIDVTFKYDDFKHNEVSK